MRFWEIDFARGAAVILMVLFNWSFALYWLGLINSDGNWFFWWLSPRLIASAFIFIAGISLSISHSKGGMHILRGAKIFAIGLGITLVTYALFPRDFIVFGILHLIGLSIILAVPLVKIGKNMVLATAAATILIGAYLQSTTFDFYHLLWLGLIPTGYTTFDYFPLLPWFGIFLMGMLFGRTVYKKRKPSSGIKYAKPFTFLGRHSLAVYIVHQPLLLAALYLAGLL